MAESLANEQQSSDPCEGCGAPVFGYVEDRCCDGRECACMGRPMTPCWCAACWEKWETDATRRSRELVAALDQLKEKSGG